MADGYERRVITWDGNPPAADGDVVELPPLDLSTWRPDEYRLVWPDGTEEVWYP